MTVRDRVLALHRLAASVALMATLATATASRAVAADPNFDGASWIALQCGDGGEAASDESPASVDLVGDVTHAAAYVAVDADYLYFRYRVDGNPSGPKGFDQYAWTALMQVPSGNQFQYQYELSLNGKGSDDDFGSKAADTVEIWANTSAEDISFSPLFNDPSEIRLFAQRYDLSGAGTVNTMPLARYLLASDGTAFGGTPDYFVDFAVPVSILIAKGVVGTPAELADSLFFPATSTNANNYNKGHLSCPFLPMTTLTLSKTATPSSAPANFAAPLSFSLDVGNAGPALARGVVIDDASLPSYMTNVAVTVSSNDPTVTWTVVSTNPVKVKLPRLSVGAGATITITGDANPSCADHDFTNNATAFASNALSVGASASFSIDKNGPEVCDGADNNCNGQADEGGSALCDDDNPCTTDTCAAGAGCMHSGIPGCFPCVGAGDCPDDGNACTTAGCTGGVCGQDSVPGCVPCVTASDCPDDGNGCTASICTAGVCEQDTVAGCIPCATPSDCPDDHNACTTDTCTAGVCGLTTAEGCIPCATPSDCSDDHNACTTATCAAGICAVDTASGCMPCASLDDCGDGNGCTVDTCDDGACNHLSAPGCVSCATASACNDSNPCTGDICNEVGVCEHATKTDCRPCSSNAECDDRNPCTKDACGTDGSCQTTVTPGCVVCSSAADCDDHDTCSEDACVAGVCSHTSSSDCCHETTEVCDDGIDNDCDDLIDCQDANCSSAPSCPHETCGNCIDDDGNGLTDFEDPACCAHVDTFAMLLKRARIRPRGETSKLRIRSTLAHAGMDKMNPLREDVFVQIKPEYGTDLLCAYVPATKFIGRKNRKFKFSDRKLRVASAKGLSDMTLKIRRDGSVKFKTRGKRAQLKGVPAGMLQVTVGFRDQSVGDAGNRCSMTVERFRLGHQGKLLAP